MSEDGEYVVGSWMDGEEFEYDAKHGSVDVRDGCLSFETVGGNGDRKYLPLASMREFVRSGALRV